MDEKLQAQIEEARAQGYNEEQIQSFIAAQQRSPMPTPTQDQFTPRFEEGVGTAQYAAAEAAKLAAIGGGGYYGLKKVAEALRGPKTAPVAGPVEPPQTRTSTPGETFEKLRSGPTASPPNSGPQFPPQTRVQPAGALSLPTMAAQGMLAAPYLGAAYEQARIRANPNAPEYQDNPYAMMTRGQAATQGQAGAMNTRQALANQQYGGLTAEQQRILEQDRIDQAIRRKAAEKVLGPIAPGQ
jgi:hypothetical protein